MGMYYLERGRLQSQMPHVVILYLWSFRGFRFSVIGHYAHTLSDGRLSRAIKRIQVSDAVKCATKCTLKSVLCTIPTLPRPLNRTLNRHAYSDTLNRTAFYDPFLPPLIAPYINRESPLIPAAFHSALFTTSGRDFRL